ncbi:MAG: hypothetical protein AAGM38_18015 [Pseudomonadota bacterium]
MQRKKQNSRRFGAGAILAAGLLAGAIISAGAAPAAASGPQHAGAACGAEIRFLVSFDAAGVSTRKTRGFARAEATRALRETMRARAEAAAHAAASSRCGGRAMAIEIDDMLAAAPVCARSWVRTIHGPRRGVECRVTGAQASAMAVLR